VPEFIDPVFAKSNPVIEKERCGLVFAKTGSKNSGTGLMVITKAIDS
jgi:hypothetical protein